MTLNRSRTNSIVFAGIAIVALAVLLFASALAGGGADRPRLLLAFLLTTGLSVALLVVLARTARSKEAVRKEAVPVAPGEVLSDSAEELRMSVAVIEEGLEEFLGEEAPADKEHLLVLYEETDRLKKIIAGMEQLSRAKEIARASRKEPVQIEQLLNAIADRTRQAVPGKDIIYTIECDPGLTVPAARESLDRIVGNIMDNAARFIKDSGTVTATASHRAGALVLAVRDTGPGIRRAHLAHIYEPFFRGTGPGIGMGLSIVKDLVDALGGTIQVQTEAGKGTTVTVELPDA